MDRRTKLTLGLSALAAGGAALHFLTLAPMGEPAVDENRATVIERTPDAVEADRVPVAGGSEAPAQDTPNATDARDERIVPPVKRVAPKAPEEPRRGAAESSAGAKKSTSQPAKSE